MPEKFNFEEALKALQAGQAITVKSSSGSFELETPRDRAGTFEPTVVKKYQTSVSDEIENKMLSMYGLGMSYRDIANHDEEPYGINVSTATISAVTDKTIDEVKQWQQRKRPNRTVVFESRS